MPAPTPVLPTLHLHLEALTLGAQAELRVFALPQLVTQPFQLCAGRRRTVRWLTRWLLLLLLLLLLRLLRLLRLLLRLQLRLLAIIVSYRCVWQGGPFEVVHGARQVHSEKEVVIVVVKECTGCLRLMSLGGGGLGGLRGGLLLQTLLTMLGVERREVLHAGT